MTRDRTLTDLEHQILDFAEQHPVLDDRSWAQMMATFGWRPMTYVQRLLALLDEPAAARERPMLVYRLQRLRDERRAARTSAFTRAG